MCVCDAVVALAPQQNSHVRDTPEQVMAPAIVAWPYRTTNLPNKESGNGELHRKTELPSLLEIIILIARDMTKYSAKTLRKYLWALGWKFKLFLKLTCGYYDTELLNTLDIKVRPLRHAWAHKDAMISIPSNGPSIMRLWGFMDHLSDVRRFGSLPRDTYPNKLLRPQEVADKFDEDPLDDTDHDLDTVRISDQNNRGICLAWWIFN